MAGVDDAAQVFSFLAAFTTTFGEHRIGLVKDDGRRVVGVDGAHQRGDRDIRGQQRSVAQFRDDIL
jgi:hypothetical protein